MKLTNFKDTLIRALKTCVQALLSYLSAQLLVGIDITSREVINSLIIGGIGAILGALSNLHIDENEYS